MFIVISIIKIYIRSFSEYRITILQVISLNWSWTCRKDGDIFFMATMPIWLGTCKCSRQLHMVNSTVNLELFSEADKEKLLSATRKISEEYFGRLLKLFKERWTKVSWIENIQKLKTSSSSPPEKRRKEHAQEITPRKALDHMSYVPQVIQDIRKTKPN